MAIKPATCEGFLHRVGFMGATGTGKTYTALKVAMTLAERVVLGEFGDERGRHKVYANAFKDEHGRPRKWMVDEIESTDADAYIRFIEDAERSGAEIGIIDQASAEWLRILERVDEAKASVANEFGAWKEPSRDHDLFVRRLLSSPMHWFVILRATMKYKLEEQKKGDRTVKVPVCIGLKPVQRSSQGRDFVYDLTGLIGMDTNHTATIYKTMGPPGSTSLDGMMFPMAGDNLAQALKTYAAQFGKTGVELAGEARELARQAVNRGAIKDPVSLESDIVKAEKSPRLGDLLLIIWALQKRLA